ncbi:MAG: hydroxyphenylacetyl-CoA thioesterase PaaI [Lautropia sp.]|nr:MAG: hydroxyphenylacetyl-CoA thioesterase PaaI [Lautropia sp.]
MNASTLPSPEAAEQLAHDCADAMWADDAGSQALGMRIESVGPGRAVLGMTVRHDMLNGHGSCHGGFLFSLADSAFAFACNSGNQRTVAQHCSITYLAPAFEHDRLTAVASEVHRAGRSGLYDVRITNQKQEAIAEFRGHARTIRGTLLPEQTC